LRRADAADFFLPRRTAAADLRFEVYFLWPPYVIGQTIILFFALRFLSSFFLFFLAQSQRSEIGCRPYFRTWCGPSANLECMSEMRCTRIAEITGRKKSPFWHHRTNL